MTRAKHSHVRKRRRSAGAPVPGAPPGTLVSQPGAAPPTIHVIGYGPDTLEEPTIRSVDELKALVGRWPVTWINVEGVGHAPTLEKLGEIFNLHRLALEDTSNTHQRAKCDEFPTFDFVVVRMCCPETAVLDTEQLALFLGPNYVITCQEGQPRDCLNSVRDRIRKAHSRIRTLGADYLAYAILDAAVDSYFPEIERISDQLETLEDAVLERPTRETATQIHDYKRQLLMLRRAIWPLREVFNILVRDETPRVRAETRIYFRDCYDHVVRQVELIENYRELCSDLMDLYLSSVSQRLNEIMKVLTLMSTLFLPLTFIVGLYGMNFDTNKSPLNMPELHWYFGYPFALLVMVLTTAGMLLYFRRKGWIGQGAAAQPPKDGNNRSCS